MVSNWIRERRTRLVRELFWLFLLAGGSDAFTARSWIYRSSFLPVTRTTSFSRTLETHQFLFGNKDDDEAKPETKPQESDDADEEKEGRSRLASFFPFFAKSAAKKKASKQPENKEPENAEKPVAVAVAVAAPAKVSNQEETPLQKAQRLKAQAERARLEAEKLDTELTLEKINKLEKELASAKTKQPNATASVQDLERQLNSLQAKMRGEAPAPPPPPPAAPLTKSQQKADRPLKPFSQEYFEELKERYEQAPDFVKKVMANMVDLDYDSVQDINITEVALRSEQLQRLDFSYSSLPKPTFTQQEIEDERVRLREEMGSFFQLDIYDTIAELANGNETLQAIYSLEYNYYVDTDNILDQDVLEFASDLDESFGTALAELVNTSALDRTVAGLYPKCVYKEDGQLPTDEEVQTLVSEVLPKAKFTSTSKPEPLLGGFVVRGTSKYETGDDLIAAIDAQLARTNLGDKMQVLYQEDFTYVANAIENDQEFDLFDEPEPILYITGKDIVREPRRLPLTLTSMLGIATSWYLSIYPFLLNPTLMKRAEEDLALADANMSPDLSWLTDLSLPLFVTFMGIQFSHEIGHKLTALTYNMNTTVPVFVPSLITGVTSVVTTFKEPPKNKEAMFDYALAGPLVGIVASIAALVFGSELTLTASAAARDVFPALPLDILRQSTLGGSVINGILGNGVLTVPDGAIGTQAIAEMNIPLHPVAIAGYIGLIVNSLSLLPIGTTDGGRIAMTVFGRTGKQILGGAFLTTLLLIGLFGSDLYLFYFAFAIAFQTGNEVPCRNEVDSVSFPRVVLAIAGSFMALLALIPFQ